MAEIQSLKIACPSCAGHIEFPVDMHGQVINCPHCSLSVPLTIPGYVCPASAPPLPQTVRGQIIRKGETFGVGCLVQLIGLVLLFIFPIGTIIGFAIMVCGQFMAYKLRCSICGAQISGKRVKMCPACRASFV
ncbi:MAG TPA: hypothetical protein DCQ92_05945 [Verrucomicrobia subdivision 3 bacterium]|nr:hypothetical protein [Limisphaerales bacterium]